MPTMPTMPSSLLSSPSSDSKRRFDGVNCSDSDSDDDDDTEAAPALVLHRKDGKYKKEERSTRQQREIICRIPVRASGMTMATTMIPLQARVPSPCLRYKHQQLLLDLALQTSAAGVGGATVDAATTTAIATTTTTTTTSRSIAVQKEYSNDNYHRNSPSRTIRRSLSDRRKDLKHLRAHRINLHRILQLQRTRFVIIIQKWWRGCMVRCGARVTTVATVTAGMINHRLDHLSDDDDSIASFHEATAYHGESEEGETYLTLLNPGSTSSSLSQLRPTWPREGSDRTMSDLSASIHHEPLRGEQADTPRKDLHVHPAQRCFQPHSTSSTNKLQDHNGPRRRYRVGHPQHDHQNNNAPFVPRPPYRRETSEITMSDLNDSTHHERIQDLLSSVGQTSDYHGVDSVQAHQQSEALISSYHVSDQEPTDRPPLSRAKLLAYIPPPPQDLPSKTRQENEECSSHDSIENDCPEQGCPQKPKTPYHKRHMSEVTLGSQLQQLPDGSFHHQDLCQTQYGGGEQQNGSSWRKIYSNTTPPLDQSPTGNGFDGMSKWSASLSPNNDEIVTQEFHRRSISSLPLPPTRRERKDDPITAPYTFNASLVSKNHHSFSSYFVDSPLRTPVRKLSPSWVGNGIKNAVKFLQLLEEEPPSTDDSGSQNDEDAEKHNGHPEEADEYTPGFNSPIGLEQFDTTVNPDQNQPMLSGPPLTSRPETGNACSDSPKLPTRQTSLVLPHANSRPPLVQDSASRSNNRTPKRHTIASTTERTPPKSCSSSWQSSEQPRVRINYIKGSSTCVRPLHNTCVRPPQQPVRKLSSMKPAFKK